MGALLVVPLAQTAAGCGAGESVAHVQQIVTLADDGETEQVRTERTATGDDGRACETTRDGSPDDLPVAVAILHRDADTGPVEAARVTDAEGPVTTRVAVRDRTAQDRRIRVDAPSGVRTETRRVGTPHLVRTTVSYPSGWSQVVPEEAAGIRTDVRDGGLEVTDVAVLFPPLTDDEIVLGVRAMPGAGYPEIVVEATPIGPSTAALLDADLLDRDAAAVVGALAEAGADGARELVDGTAQLAAGLSELAGGSDELAGGLGAAADGVGALAGGARGLAAGGEGVAAGAGELAAGLDELRAGGAALGAGNRELAVGLRQAADAADELAEGNEEAAEGNQQLADRTSGLVLAAELLGLGLGEITDAMRLLEVLPEGVLPAPLGPLLDQLGAAADQVEEFGDGLARISTGNAELAEANRQLAEGNRELARNLREAAAAADALGAGGEQLAAGASEASDGAGELAVGAGELADGAGELATGTEQVGAGIGEARAGADELAAGTGEVADGADELADGAGELPGAIDRARDTADRNLERAAERDALVDEGRARAEAAVASATEAEEGTFTTLLTAAGDEPRSPWVWVLLGTGVLAAGGGVWWWRRAEVAA